MSRQRNKVGILTFHEVFNPGAFLQAYATSQLLQELGYPADIINYNTPGFRYHPLEHLWQLRGKLRTNYLTWMDAVRKHWAFRGARKEHFSLPDGRLTADQLKSVHYESIIIGSDIVWNFQLRDDPVYFGNGLLADRLVAFAPSCGSCPLDGEIPDYVGAGLKNFTRLCARDATTADFVKGTTSKSCPIICDPTFHLAGSPILNGSGTGDYILVYLIPELTSKELLDQIRELSRKTKLPVHAVYYRHMWADRNIMYCDPFQWIHLIADARLVITNTFHGTLFSILTESNFVLEYSPLSESKTRGIMEDCDLTDRLFNRGSSLERMNGRATDYSKARSRIAERARGAREYLKEALECSNGGEI